MTTPDYEKLLPTRMRWLGRDELGRPVPWFVQWFGHAGEPVEPGHGKPDFRVADGIKFQRAVARDLCWVCGGKLGRYKAFTIGPMCAVNRNTAEPPEHRECAVYSATHCPFLVTPARRRVERDRPEGTANPAGIMLERNPGVALVWITETYRILRDGNGLLFRLGDPSEVLWYAEGRLATREEVQHSIETGLPALRQIAESHEELAELELAAARAEALLPA